jgi:hypothetical protein
MKKNLRISGAQEVPPHETSAEGKMDVSYNKCEKVLTYSISWKHLSGEITGSHIHGEAARGVNAGVVHSFTSLIPKTTSGTFTNTVAVDGVSIDEDALLHGLYYLNIHTPKYPGGEIRGQIEFK